MSAHDFLMGELIRLQKLLIEYNEEFQPREGAIAEEYMGKLLLTVHRMPDIEEKPL